MPDFPARIGPSLNVAAYVVGGAICLGAGLALSQVYAFEIGIERRGTDRAGSSYMPDYRVEVGDQLVMVYLGSSTCGWSNAPGLPEAVEAAKLRLAAHALESDLSFKAMGVALEWSVSQGMKHLGRFGRFDEVAAGYSWGNDFALTHLWTDPSEVPSTPQILVYHRRVMAPLSEGDEMRYRESDRRLLLTLRGLDEITGWAKGGTPLPPIDLREPSLGPSPSAGEEGP
jgi:hypothetical protein